MVTVVGLPLGILALIGYIGGIIFSWFMAPVLLGAILTRWWKKGELEVSWVSITTGVLAYTLIGVVPILGALTQCALMVIVFGGILAMKWDIIREWR
jgi:biotin transporter BioY